LGTCSARGGAGGVLVDAEEKFRGDDLKVRFGISLRQISYSIETDWLLPQT